MKRDSKIAISVVCYDCEKLPHCDDILDRFS